MGCFVSALMLLIHSSHGEIIHCLSRFLPRPIMLQSINSDIFAIFRASWTWFPASSYNSLRDGSNFNKKIIFLSSSRWIFSYASCMALRMAVRPLLCSRLKHLKNDLMICHEIWTDIHGTQKMNHKDCSDIPILPLAPLGGSSLWIWVKCLNNCLIDFCDIWCRRSCSPQDELLSLFGDPSG